MASKYKSALDFLQQNHGAEIARLTEEYENDEKLTAADKARITARIKRIEKEIEYHLRFKDPVKKKGPSKQQDC